MIISKTPLRISLFGGGTDIRSFYQYEPGMVLSSSIDKYVYVVVKRRFDDSIRVAYSQTETVPSVDEIQHDLVREAMRVVGIKSGLEIVTLSDIPSRGTGLGSSSVVTVGLLNALYTYIGHRPGPEQLAKEACHIEIDVLGAPIGKQDQYIAAYGGFRKFEFRPDESVNTEEIPIEKPVLSELQDSLLLFFTGMTRSASVILRKQMRDMPNKLHTFRAMKQQVDQALIHLNAKKPARLGRELHRAWQLKRSLSDGITNSAIDEFYTRALQAGAYGGKIAGGGGGGFLLLYCPAARQARVRAALHDLRELPFRFSERGSQIIFYQEE